MLNCTWDDVEQEAVMLKSGARLDEQKKALNYYLQLREQYRKSFPQVTRLVSTEKKPD